MTFEAWQSVTLLPRRGENLGYKGSNYIYFQVIPLAKGSLSELVGSASYLSASTRSGCHPLIHALPHVSGGWGAWCRFPLC